MAEPMLSLKNVHKRFGGLNVLNGVDLDVAKGEVICILGPSGSGKSTLLRCVNLLAPPEEGEIFLVRPGDEIRIYLNRDPNLLRRRAEQKREKQEQQPPPPPPPEEP